MPRPHGPKTVHKRDVFPEIGIEPEAGRDRKISDAEQNDSEDCHEKEQAEHADGRPAQVIDALAQLHRPQWIQHYDENDDEREGGVQLALDLAALVQPDVVHVVFGVLLLFDVHVPLAFDALGLLAVGPELWLDFAHT